MHPLSSPYINLPWLRITHSTRNAPHLILHQIISATRYNPQYIPASPRPSSANIVRGQPDIIRRLLSRAASWVIVADVNQDGVPRERLFRSQSLLRFVRATDGHAKANADDFNGSDALWRQSFCCRCNQTRMESSRDRVGNRDFVRTGKLLRKGV